ncbi:MAG: hypothetical protein ACSLFD_00665 [Solirubrobacterales bacterium]
MNRRLTAVLTGLCAAIVLLGGAQVANAAKKTVTISGKAYIFNHMDTLISNAPIKVREFPKLSTSTNAIGDYKLKVPNNANVTPYIPSGTGPLTRYNLDDYSPKGPAEETHWNEVDHQTFHTRGADLENVNFQTPADLEYAGLKAILSVQTGPDGRPTNCAIVTTASMRSVRGVDYNTFEKETAEHHGHGVPGATSIAFPSLGSPVYFNEHVIPDESETETSKDGGIVWTEIPTGNYRVVTSSESERFASFLATCKAGRVIVPNPPWGAYELGKGEKPLGAGNVAATVKGANAVSVVKSPRNPKTVSRRIEVGIVTGEKVSVLARVKKAGRTISSKRIKGLTASRKTVRLPIRRKVPAGMVKTEVTITDASGVSFTSKRWELLPGIRK